MISTFYIYIVPIVYTLGMVIWLRKLFAPRRAFGTEEDKMSDSECYDSYDRHEMVIKNSEGRDILILDYKGNITVPEHITLSEAAFGVMDAFASLIAMAHDSGKREGFKRGVELGRNSVGKE